MYRLNKYLVIVYTILALSTLAMAQDVCFTYRLIDIPTPGHGLGYTSLEGINRAGIAVGRYAGEATLSGYQLERQGVRKQKLKVLPMPPPAGMSTWPRAINTQRDTAGMAQIAPGKYVGYVRRHLKVPKTELVAFPGATSTEVLGMNSKRDLVGYYNDANGVSHGFWRYQGQLLTIDAPFAGVEGTELTDINLSQDIVGWYYAAEGIHGLHIVDGLPVTLDVPGALFTFLTGLNDAGHIVGFHTMGDYGAGFLYKEGEFYEITPGVGEIDSKAHGINNAGEIVGDYISADGLLHGYIATPSSCANAVAQR